MSFNAKKLLGDAALAAHNNLMARNFGQLVRCASDGPRGNYLETAGSVVKFAVAEKIDDRYFDLFAASPEMLKMLELAVRELEWADQNCQIKPMAGVSTFKTAVAQIKSVIAKATGGAR